VAFNPENLVVERCSANSTMKPLVLSRLKCTGIVAWRGLLINFPQQLWEATVVAVISNEAWAWVMMSENGFLEYEG